MRYLKMLGLAVIAAAALSAVAGVGSASAYTLCQSEVDASGNCPTSPGMYSTGQVFKAHAATATLTLVGGFSGQTAMTCTSDTEVEQTSTGNDTGGAVNGTVKSLEFNNCVTDPSGSKCTVSKGSGYTGTIVGTDDKGHGTMTVTSTTSTEVNCAGILECTFTTAKNGVTLTVNQGNPASFVANEVKLGKAAGGFLCPSEAKWDATYTLTSPTALWVATGDA